MDFLCKFGEHLWVTFLELLAVTGSLLGVFGVVPEASTSPDQAKFCVRPSIRTYDFFDLILEQRNGILVEET